MSTQPEKDLSFAHMLNALEEIVKNLESGELSLEDSLAQFEKGVKLARTLESTLSKAETRVQEILKDGDHVPSRELEGPDAVDHA